MQKATIHQTLQNEVYAYGNNKNGVLGNGVAYTNGTFSDENGTTVTEDALGNEVKKTVVFPLIRALQEFRLGSLKHMLTNQATC